MRTETPATQPEPVPQEFVPGTDDAATIERLYGREFPVRSYFPDY